MRKNYFKRKNEGREVRQEGRMGRERERGKRNERNLSKTRKVVHYLQKRNRLTDIENKLMVTKGER